VLAQVDTVADAIESGNPIEIQAALPRLFEANFVMIDNQYLAIRNRMAALPAKEPTRQSVGIISLVYRVMGVASRGWVRAHMEGKAEEAEAALIAELKNTAAESAAFAATGRANLALEMKDLDARIRSTRDPRARALLERFKASRVSVEPMFVIGDDLSRLAESASGDPKAALAGDSDPAILTPLVALEQRFIAINAQRTAALQAGGN
jgi:hypothetical protein